MFVKKMYQGFFILIFLSAFLRAENFIILNNSFKNAENSLIEVFSYRCIHCYNHHKFGTLTRIKDKIPNLNYQVYPVALMNGKFAKEINEFFAFALSKDMKNNKNAADKNSFTHNLADVYFTSYFINKKDFQDLQTLTDISLNTLNASKEEVQSFLQSPQAKAILENYALANEAARTYGTPSFIVNGKYQIKPEALNSLENLEKLVKELSQK